jgi:catechol 2,3-dioxygenase-like lactoylglutathione lyase family enzyme
MVHHVSVGTNDIKRARAFYEPLMSHIGFRLLKASDKAVQFGSSDIMFSLETPISGLPATPGNGVHVAFQAPDRQTVRRFYAIASGATGEGAPGPRENYNANYYCAFVRDPDEKRLRPLRSQRGKHSNDGIRF